MTKTKKIKLTQQELKEGLKYDPTTGVFVWEAVFGRRTKIGSAAGSQSYNDRWVIRYKGNLYYAHRLAWLYVYGEFPESMIDHIDGNPLNNRIQNLRVCTSKENQKNQGIPKHNTSGFKGVSKFRRDNKWQAQARLEGKDVYLGLFNTPEEASEAYNTFAKQHHGEFYRDTTGTSE